jgi:hypothetical protein
MVQNNRLISSHQFGFRQTHSTIEQTHRIVQRINEALENNHYCSAVFLDISKAFDKILHTGLLYYKLRLHLPLKYYLILKSYLDSRYFLVKAEHEYTGLFPVNAGVLQGSVPGPLLHLLYTADLPISPESTIATFAEDTAVIATDNVPAIASHKLQTNLLTIQHWLKKRRMKVKGSKSTHVTFTTGREKRPSFHINNVQLPQAEDVRYLGLNPDRSFTYLQNENRTRNHSLRNVLAAWT